ncbi:hypothetical protein E4U57_008192, partial [Claviceps arundinis]
MGPSPQQQTQPSVVVTPNRGLWSPHEDYMLKRRVMEKGTHDWVEKSKYVGTRTAKQCRERWYQSLKPDLNRSRITKEEGDIIIDRATRKGQGWAEIARQLKGRSDNLVKNWYYGRKKRSE